MLGSRGQVRVLGKLLFNCLPAMIRSTKFPYCGLLIKYAYAKSAMQASSTSAFIWTALGPILFGDWTVILNRQVYFMTSAEKRG